MVWKQIQERRKKRDTWPYKRKPPADDLNPSFYDVRTLCSQINLGFDIQPEIKLP